MSKEDPFKLVGEPLAKKRTDIRGLGDIVEIVAKPIARTIDKVAGTDMENCSSCAQRKAWLNEFFSIEKN